MRVLFGEERGNRPNAVDFSKSKRISEKSKSLRNFSKSESLSQKIASLQQKAQISMRVDTLNERKQTP